VNRAAALLAAACLLGCAGDSDPVPVQRYLVYTKAGTILIGDGAGRGMRRLTRGDYGLVSPDGRLVAITRPSGVDLIAPDGAEGGRLGPGRAAAWFADSRHLLVYRRRALVNADIDGGDSETLVRDSALLRGISVSPTGARLAYGLARRESRAGECGEYTDVFVVDHDGTSRRQLTHDGRSSDPVWRDERIAFAREPVKPACAMPRSGIWTMRENGSDVRAILRQAPRRFAEYGYYGLRPYGGVSGRRLFLAGIRSEWSDELALAEIGRGRIRRLDLDPHPRYRRPFYIDHVSHDGRHALGATCLPEAPCTIRIFSVIDGKARDLITGRVSSPHWNR